MPPNIYLVLFLENWQSFGVICFCLEYVGIFIIKDIYLIYIFINLDMMFIFYIFYIDEIYINDKWIILFMKYMLLREK